MDDLGVEVVKGGLRLTLYGESVVLTVTEALELANRIAELALEDLDWD